MFDLLKIVRLPIRVPMGPVSLCGPSALVYNPIDPLVSQSKRTTNPSTLPLSACQYTVKPALIRSRPAEELLPTPDPVMQSRPSIASEACQQTSDSVDKVADSVQHQAIVFASRLSSTAQ